MGLLPRPLKIKVYYVSLFLSYIIQLTYVFLKYVQIAKEHGGIVRFVQVSCLGSSASSPSRLLKAKAAAEEAVLRELPEVNLSV